MAVCRLDSWRNGGLCRSWFVQHYASGEVGIAMLDGQVWLSAGIGGHVPGLGGSVSGLRGRGQATGDGQPRGAA